MNINKDFLSDLLANSLLSSNISIQNFLPKLLSPPACVVNNLPFVQAFGNIHSTYPYYYETSGLDTYCIIYTESGTGQLFLDSRHYSIIPNTLALIDCNKCHKIKINQSPWNYKVYYIKGAYLPFIYSSLTEHNENLYSFPTGSDIPCLIQKLYIQLDKSPDNFFLHAKFICDILFDLLIEKSRSEESETHIPDYLAEIKHQFDNNYYDTYSLDTLERRYHISKYRLCREFTEQINISPIQYLNQRRIEAAKDALRYTDKRINEIGRMVGFDNTNHFIRLFKRQTGVTPLIFRKQPPVVINIK